MAKPKKNPVDTRSALKKLKDAAYASLPPALVLKPLKFIREKVGHEELKNGVKVWVDGEFYFFIKNAPGGAIKRIAREMAAHVA